MSSTTHAKQSDEADQEVQDFRPTKPMSRFTRWFRSPLFNVILEPYLVNGANSLTFGIMVFGCSFFAIMANKIGIKTVLIIGTLGYAPYSASLYVNNRYGVEWFVLFGGATCGLAASALWAAEGAIALGYADIKDRGKFTGIWLGLRELGQLLGSSIQLSLNAQNGQRGKVGYSTYLVLIALQCLGLLLALLISPPQKVIHSDGRKVADPTKNKAVMGEFHKWLKLLRNKKLYLLIPILVGFNWNSTYQGIYLTKYFSVRARTLGGLTSGIAASAANMFWGWFYDLKCFSRPQLARITWASFSIIMLGLITLDWTSPGFGRGFAVNVLFRFMNESHYMSVYWLMGTFFDDIETLTLGVGLVRSFESIGSCLSFGIGAVKISPMVNLIVAFVMFAVCIPATSWVVFLVPERPVNNAKTSPDNTSIEDNKVADPVIVSAAAAATDGPRST
ncbi:MFS general substrate transporter [Colletotrichum somersetense]|nr:MFS general substrate transporter [Colletotrichum somersetense]